MQMKLLVLAPIALTSLGSLAFANQGITETKVTVCSLVVHAHEHQSSRVHLEVSGEVHGGVDRLILSDSACPETPIEFSISNDVAKKPRVARLWSAIYHDGSIGTVGKRIKATIIGTVRFKDKGWPRVILTTDDVVDLEVTHLTDH